MRSVVAAGLLIAALLMAGCKKEPPASAGQPSAPASTKEQDALWALAPPGAIAGFVASPQGVAMLERSAIAIDALLNSAAELAPLRRQLDQMLTREAGIAKLRLAELGLTADKGFAAFSSGKDKGLLIIPVSDRDKFLAKVHGTKGTDHDMINGHPCKTVDGRYACAASADMLAKLGGGDLSSVLKLAGARGELEVAGHRFTSPEDPRIAVVAQLARGSFILRGTVQGVPSMVTEMIGSASRPAVDPTRTGGFGMVDATPYLAKLPPAPIVADVTLDGLGKTVAGPIALTIAAGTTDPDLRIPLSDTAPAKALVEHCAELPPLASIGATVSNGICHIPFPAVKVSLDAWIDGKQLRIANRAGAPGVAIGASPLAEELARGQWAMVFFGRGSAFDLSAVPDAATLLQALPTESLIALRAMTLFNELGVGLRKEGDALHFILGMRTVWANPDDVVQRLLAISPGDIISGKAAETGKSIASAAPGSVFASDFKAGIGGMITLAMPIGILAAVAIPAFMDYMKRSRKTEAALQLDKLGRNAKRAYIETGAFPKGDAALTTAAPCCGQPRNRCAAPPEAWQQPVWRALDFQIDEPALFQYSYESDGKTFVAKAVGDLDCDGTTITYELRGTSENGNPAVTLIEPAVGAD